MTNWKLSSMIPQIFPWPQHQAPEHQHKAPLIQGLSMPLD